MKKTLLLTFSTSLLFAAGAFAQDGKALLKEHKCSSCHRAAVKTVGPSIKEMAEKYQNTEGAQALLEERVRKGGRGVWGSAAMPPTPNSVSDADIKAMVTHILENKK